MENLQELLSIFLSNYFIEKSAQLVSIHKVAKDPSISNPENIFQVQVALLDLMSSLQTYQQEVKSGKVEPPSGMSQKMLISCTRQLDYLLKTIADGIVYRVLAYDQPFIRVMAETNRSHNAVDTNRTDFTRTVRRAHQKLLRSDHFLLINDITNVLRCGDFLTVATKDGVVEILEAKESGKKFYSVNSMSTSEAKGKSNTPNKQMIAKVEPAQFARNQRIIKMPGNQSDVAILHLAIPFEHNFKCLNSLMYKARRKKIVCKNFQDYLYLTVINLNGATAEEIHDTPKPNQPGDYYIQISTLDLLTYDPNNGDFSRNNFPLPVWPISTVNSFDLLTGRMVLLAWINVSSVKREFKNQGWEIIDSGIDPKELTNTISRIKVQRRSSGTPFEHRPPEQLFLVKKNGFQIDVTISEIISILTEMVNPKYLVDKAEAVRNATKPGQKQDIAIYNTYWKSVWK